MNSKLSLLSNSLSTMAGADFLPSMNRFTVFLVAGAFISITHATVAQMGYKFFSLESMVAQSRVVARGTVAAVATNSVEEQWVEKSVTININETLKGEHTPQLQYFVRTHSSDDSPEKWKDSQQEVLWFLTQNEVDKGRNASVESAAPHEAICVPASDWYFIELVDAIDKRLRHKPPPPIYSMNLTLLENPKEIVQAARRAVREEEAKLAPQSHRVSVSRFIAQQTGTSGDVNSFVVPVDSRLQPVALRWIIAPDETLSELRENPINVIKGSERWKRWSSIERSRLREEGIKALRYFKSDENIAILRESLNDPAWSYHTEQDKNGLDIRVKAYYIREAAFSVLKGWDVEIQRPILTEEF